MFMVRLVSWGVRGGSLEQIVEMNLGSVQFKQIDCIMTY